MREDRCALSSRLLPVVQKTIRGQLKEFRHRLQVPIRFIDMDVPEVGGQLREFSFHVESLSIPPDQRTSGKSVTHVREPGTTAMALCRATETELLRYLGEGVARYPLRDPGTALGDEKGRGRFGKDAISRLSVFSERVYRRWMNRHVARLAELRAAYGENSLIEVHIWPVQM